MLKKILLDDKTPFLLTVLISLAAYQMNNLIQIYTDAPILLYKFVNKSNRYKKDENQIIDCILHNISRRKAIKEVKIYVSYASKDFKGRKITFKNPKIIAVTPSAPIPDDNIELDIGLKNIYFEIPVIQPNTRYRLSFMADKLDKRNHFPNLYMYSTESIRLEQLSFETFLLKNQVIVNTGLFLIWIVVIIIYLFIMAQTKNEEKNEGI